MSITLTTASFDKSSYGPGDLVTLTVRYTSTDTQANPNSGTQQYAVSLTLTDDAGVEAPGSTGDPASVYTEVIPDTMAQPITVSAVENPYPSGPASGRSWEVVSNTQLAFDADTGTSTWEAVLSVQIPLSS